MRGARRHEGVVMEHGSATAPNTRRCRFCIRLTGPAAESRFQRYPWGGRPLPVFFISTRSAVAVFADLRLQPAQGEDPVARAKEL
jgi:hypothetical protein